MRAKRPGSRDFAVLFGPQTIFAMASKGTLFKRFVEPGRLALITYGPCEGKLCTVIDICTQKKVVVDGPECVTGVRRHLMPVRRLSLTDFKCQIPRGAREKTLKKALNESGAREKTLKK